MKALSLFSGIGGIDLAGEWAGIETVAMCEREPFCQKVLRKHWPDKPIYDDVCTLTKERLEADGIDTRSIGLIHFGYPCQPFSVAGERKGAGDDRHLWPQVNRILSEIRPRWALGENVVGHVTLGLDDVLDDLADNGYTAQPFVIPACGVGADHKRERVFIVAHANEQYVEGSCQESISWEPQIQGQLYDGSAQEWARRSAVYEPKLSRNHNGLSGRMDGVARIKALGNAVVPAQVYPLLAAIKQIDDMLHF